MAPSNSSSPKTNQKLEAMVVAQEEKRTMNDPKQGSPQEVVPERETTEVPPKRKITEKPRGLHVGLSVLRAAKNIRKTLNPPREIRPLVCNVCERGFCNVTALRRHQNIHKSDQEVERMLTKKEPSYSPGQGFWRQPRNSHQGTSTEADEEVQRMLKKKEPSYSPGQGFGRKPHNSHHSVNVGGYSQDALLNDKYLGISRDPSESIGGDGRSIRSAIRLPPFNSGFRRDNRDINMAVGYPVPPYGNTSLGFSSGIPLVTHNNKHLTLVSKRENDINDDHLTLSDFDRRGLSFGPFTPRGGGSSIDNPSFYNGGITMAPPAASYRHFTQNTSYASPSKDPVSLDLSLRQPNDKGSCSSNNDNSSTQGLLSLGVSLGTSKSTGGSNSTSSVNQPFNGGVTGGGLTDLNLPVRPRVSRFHFYSHNPLDSIMRDVPLSHPPPNDENVSGSDRKGKKPKL